MRGSCSDFYNLFLDGFDAANWDVGLYDRSGAPVPHGLFRTDSGVVISIESVENLFSEYHLVFAQKSARGVTNRFQTRIQAADAPYLPRSLDDIIF